MFIIFNENPYLYPFVKAPDSSELAGKNTYSKIESDY